MLHYPKENNNICLSMTVWAALGEQRRAKRNAAKEINNVPAGLAMCGNYVPQYIPKCVASSHVGSRGGPHTAACVAVAVTHSEADCSTASVKYPRWWSASLQRQIFLNNPFSCFKKKSFGESLSFSASLRVFRSVCDGLCISLALCHRKSA